MKTKSVLSYFGSDSEVAPELGAMLDHCKHVTIPFVGGGSILPYLKARAIVANDKHDLAINFYRVLSGWYGVPMRDEVIHRCEHTLSHPSDLELACETFKHSFDHVEYAWAFWALCWIGRKGKGGTKNQTAKMPSVRWTPAGGTNASRIRAAADDLKDWCKQFERCEWLELDFRDVLDRVNDNEACGAYCDPPWVGAGDGYLHSFTEKDHRDLAWLVNQFEKTTVLMRYGDAPLIRELYADWNIIEASSRDQCNAVKGELWITNKP